MAKRTGKFKKDMEMYGRGIRRCSKCLATKPISDFHKRNDAVGVPLKSICKECRNLSRAAWYSDNAAERRVKGAEYREMNREALKLWRKKDYLLNREKRLAASRNWRKINWQRFLAKCREYYYNNKARSFQKGGRRRATEVQAEPNWLTPIQKAQMQEFYEISLAKFVQTGVKHHVDHIVPLNNMTVRGLHVPWNLQILTKHENLKKHNKLPTELSN